MELLARCALTHLTNPANMCDDRVVLGQSEEGERQPVDLEMKALELFMSDVAQRYVIDGCDRARGPAFFAARTPLGPGDEPFDPPNDGSVRNNYAPHVARLAAFLVRFVWLMSLELDGGLPGGLPPLGRALAEAVKAFIGACRRSLLPDWKGFFQGSNHPPAFEAEQPLGEEGAAAGAPVEQRSEQYHRRRGIIFTRSCKRCAKVYGALLAVGVDVVMYRSSEDKIDKEATRAEAFARFTSDHEGLIVMVATTAAGVSLDHDRVRWTIHDGGVYSDNSLLQEAGRGGRDGQPSLALLLVDGSTMSWMLHTEREARRSGSASFLHEYYPVFKANSIRLARSLLSHGVAGGQLMGVVCVRVCAWGAVASPTHLKNHHTPTRLTRPIHQPTGPMNRIH